MVPTVLNEGRRPAEFMISEGPGLRSRDVGHFLNSGTVELDLPSSHRRDARRASPPR